ncbi:MAG: cytochrome c biogenesis protein [Nitrospirota bacterium]|nr:cytochrome c biogenesis protein [Nitrospirota bacterium]
MSETIALNLFWASFVVLSGYWAADFAKKGIRIAVLGTGLALLVAALTVRGAIIAYLPLTNKFESFCTYSTMAFAVLLYTSIKAKAHVAGRIYRLSLFAMGYAFMVAAALFPKEISYPPPLMITVWYVMHVPLAFFAYALCTSAGAGALQRMRAVEALERLDIDTMVGKNILWGFIIFSITMVFGGIWGYVAWGSYFLWDQKVMWSVVLWFFYATVAHMEFRDELQQKRPFFALLGVFLILVTYVGTSFFMKSSHSF